MGEIVGYAGVYGGEEPQVGLTGDGAIFLYVPRGSRRCLTANITYEWPVLPPVEQGQRIAALNVLCDGQLIQSAPLYASESVAEGNLVRKSVDALKELAIGWLPF